jgi:hypothetical protein
MKHLIITKQENLVRVCNGPEEVQEYFFKRVVEGKSNKGLTSIPVWDATIVAAIKGDGPHLNSVEKDIITRLHDASRTMLECAHRALSENATDIDIKAALMFCHDMQIEP